MNGNICEKTILKTASIAIFAAIFYTSCDDNGVKVVTPEVRTFTDKRDGKTYKEVTIGEQRWMAENLRYEADGSVCFNENGSFWGNKDPAQNCETYGRLYDWNTAMNGELSSNAAPSGVEGVCPVGWHIPSDAEWAELIDYVGINAGIKLRARSWRDTSPGAGEGTPTPDGTDKYRFSALPGGAGDYHEGQTSFIHLGWNGFWWSSTENHSNEAWMREIMGSQNEVRKGYMDKHQWFLSVRCVHD